MQAFNTPYYTSTHRKHYTDEKGNLSNRTQVIRAHKDPTYARRKAGYPIQLLHDHDYNTCFELIIDLQDGKMRPEYVVLYEFFYSDSLSSYELCIQKFESLGFYTLEKTFKTDIEPRNKETFLFWHRTKFLYKLKPEYKPFN